jgi:hypothetical protein
MSTIVVGRKRLERYSDEDEDEAKRMGVPC